MRAYVTRVLPDPVLRLCNVIVRRIVARNLLLWPMAGVNGRHHSARVMIGC